MGRRIDNTIAVCQNAMNGASTVMEQGGKNLWIFISFLGAIILIAALNIFSFWGTFVFTLLTMSLLTVFAATTEFGQSGAGYVIGNLGRNNNHRLLALIFITLFFFIMAIKYGGGEPLIYSAIKDGKEVLNISDDSKVKGEINYLLWGKKDLSEAETDKEYPMEGKTWFWWKGFISLFIITLFYLPFAFADEVSSILHDLAIKIRNARESTKNQNTPSSTDTEEKTSAKHSDFGSKTIGLFAKLYGSDLASEFTMKFLQSLAKFFSRR